MQKRFAGRRVFLVVRRAAAYILLALTIQQTAPSLAEGYDLPRERQVAIIADGVPVENAMAYILDGSAYVALRAVSEALGAKTVSWSSATREAYVEAEGVALSVAQGAKYLSANGRCLYLPDTCIMKSGTLFVPVRALCKAFGAEVEWDAGEYAVRITSTGVPIEGGGSFYNSEDLYWLSRIIQAEARGEPLEGKIAVGNVVLNRVKSPLYPNTVYGVVFDKKYGVQFTPAYSGAIKNTPSEESIIAAKLALEGANTAGDSMYFSQTYIAAGSWAGRNRPYVVTIGSHAFYA